MLGISPALVYLGSGTALVYLVVDRATAWYARTDPDAAWHLLGMACGSAIALALR